MVYDTFMFFNELDLLEIRMEELWDIVDKFVITEATTTHRGNPKRLIFSENKERFKKYDEKIIHFVVDDLGHDSNNPWVAEGNQRDYFATQMVFSDNDIIIIGDVDEIPKGSTLKRSLPRTLDEDGIRILVQAVRYYYVNYVSNRRWLGTLVTYASKLKGTTPTKLRTWMHGGQCSIRHLYDGGWHFSYIAEPSVIKEKIRSFAHDEYDKEEIHSIEHITQCINDGIDVFGRGMKFEVSNDGDLPRYLIENKDKFQSLFYNKGESI